MRRLPSVLALLCGLLPFGSANAGESGRATGCVVPAGRVVYDGNVVRNPHVRRQLDALRCGLTREGYPPQRVRLVVSGGESYVGPSGRVYSVSNRERIAPRNRRSAHNVENGARAVDIWRVPGITDAAFRRVLARYTGFVSPAGHGRRHWHLRLPDRAMDCPASLCVRFAAPRHVKTSR